MTWTDGRPVFHDRYADVVLETSSGYRAKAFFHKYSVRLGYRAFGQGMEIPGFLFSGDSSVVRSTDEKRLATDLNRNRPLRLEMDLPIDFSGVSVVSTHPEAVAVKVTQQDSGADLVELFTTQVTPVEVDRVILLWETDPLWGHDRDRR